MSLGKFLEISDKLSARIEANSFPIPVTGCVVWTGKIDPKGYGMLYVRAKKTVLAHRAVFEIANGAIDDSLVIDHLCRVRCCINPLHMEQVTLAENTRRGDGICSINRRKTHCVRGHMLSGDNIYIRSDGCRICKQCEKQTKSRYLANKAKAKEAV